ncbi:MAG: Gfo/Idh/MocA family oxidoreductase [Bacteroidota bacterium]
MKNFALIGAAGYIAPRHMQAIKETGNNLVAAYDPFDSVGVIDRYFPEADFFTEYERFDRHLEKLKRDGTKVDFVSVCSPNYLHDAHIRFGLRYGADVICEKPLVLNPWNVDALKDIENETQKKIYNILQLRLHPNIVALKKKIEDAPKGKIFEINLTYLTARGNWYYSSWKGDQSKSGGIATNIGIHFFDMLLWIFGGVQKSIVHIHAHDRAAGYLQLQRANIKWFLGINKDLLSEKERVHRTLEIDGEQFDFSSGFEDLHTKSYQYILSESGFGLKATKHSIELVNQIRNASIEESDKDRHQLCSAKLSKHPFSR